jgi:hypothetical protein
VLHYKGFIVYQSTSSHTVQVDSENTPFKIPTGWRVGNTDQTLISRSQKTSGKNCDLLVCYVASIGTTGYLLDSRSLKMEPIGFPETSARNYHYSLRNYPEERSSHLFRSESLKPSRRGIFQWRVCWGFTKIRNGIWITVRTALMLFRINEYLSLMKTRHHLPFTIYA